MLRKLALRNEKILRRVSEILPGLLIWLIFTSPFWLSPNFPALIGNLIIILSVYWLYRAIMFTYGIYIGYQRYRSDIAINWLDKCNKLDFAKLSTPETLPKSSNLPKHLIVIPVGGSRYHTLKPTLEAIKDQNYPLENIYLSLSFEENLVKEDPKYFHEVETQIKNDFSVFQNRLMIFEHPANLPGEVKGAASNRTWGNKKAVETLEKRGENINDFITTSPDEDIRFHKEYLAAVSYHYLINPEREKRFYQTAMYLFTNNYWEVPNIVRAWSMSLSMPTLSSSVTHLHDRETWSCYSLNLGVLKAVNYWNTAIGIDDTPFFWRPFDYFNGNFECVAFFVPLFADNVYHPNKVQNYIALYKQLVRWGWGVVTVPIALRVLFSNKKIPFWLKLRKLRVMFELVVLFKLASILFTIALPIVGLMNQNFQYSILAYSLPQTLSVVMQLLTILVIPNMYFKLKLMPPKPKSMSNLKFILSFLFEIPLHLLILYTYSFFPFIVGPTQMMFGKKYGFLITTKH